MEIKANGKTYELEQGATLTDFLKDKGFAPEKVVVSVNDKVVQPEEYTSIELNDGDNLNIMSFVGGG
jgi:thiamine biosynthesis protein ThiS